MRKIVAIVLGLVLAPSVCALEVDAYVGDHMVVQQHQPWRLSGAAAPGARVSATFRGTTISTTADDEGDWQLTFIPGAASKTAYEIRVESGGETKQFIDIMVGEVWLCSGQSNMAWRMADSARFEEFRALADRPLIRMFTVGHRPTPEPVDDVEGTWTVASQASVGAFSAVAYHFGVQLQQQLDIPIGLVHASWGGSKSEAWTSRDALRRLRPGVRALQRATEAQGDPESSMPVQHRACLLFNGMIHPLLDVQFAGVIWYQGESNAMGEGEAEAYVDLFPALIYDWRWRFESPELPFYFVQIASLDYRVADWNFPMVREAQRRALRLPATGMVVTIDIGDARDIHPRNKHDVGERLARWALSDTYGRTGIVKSGPLVTRARTVEAGGIELTFDCFGSTLVAGTDGAVAAIEVARFGEAFHPAPGQITTDGRVLVSVPAAIRADGIQYEVRYAWAPDPTAPAQGGANLRSESGLPASPFRVVTE